MYYCYKIEWSQTDSDYVIFKSDNPAEYLKSHWPRAKYYYFCGKANNLS